MSIDFIQLCAPNRRSGVQGQSPWSGNQAAKPPPSQRRTTFSFWTFNGSRKFACFL